MSRHSDMQDPPLHPGWLTLLLLLWLQLFATCIYAWRFGDYYDYGWYVPPLFGWFLWRIRGQFSSPRPTPIPTIFVALGLAVLTAALFCFRVVERVDPRWTLPIWIHAFTVIAMTLLIAYRAAGLKATLRLLPIILFACTAIPLPSVIERFLVSSLTDGVVSSSVMLLQLLGIKVEAFGGRLTFMNEVVEVTEGCSGVRSAQSFLMSSLFFGELMKLRPLQRVAMVAFGVLVAWILNVIRASSLAMIQFKNGAEAFEQAHDMAGLLAFAAGSIVLLAFSSWISKRDQGRLVRKRIERRTA